MTTPARTLVKVCGLTTVADALATAAAGADWIGLNFHPPSPRFVPLDEAAAIVAALPEGVEPVGLFVDRPPAEVVEVAARFGLHTIQLHGSEPPEQVAALHPLRVVRAFRLGDSRGVAAMLVYLGRCQSLGFPPFAILVDAYVAGLPGGTGHSIPVDVLSELPPLPRLILAGGLTPENVGERVARARPWMVDVAGGVESAPGRKDAGRVAAFVRSAKTGSRSLALGREKHIVTLPPRTFRELLDQYSGGRRDFSRAELDEDLERDLCGATLADIDLTDSSIVADFRSADLRRARFSRANLKTCDFRGADLRGADFAGAALCGTRFQGARLEGARFAGSYSHSRELAGGEQPDW